MKDDRTGAHALLVLRWRDEQARPASDWVAEETPVALVVNGISHAVMLATPADLEDFGRGFAWTEGLVDRPEDLLDIEVEVVGQGINVQLEVSAASAWRLRERRRTLAGRTGCGLCGTDSLDMVRQPLNPVAPLHLTTAAISRAHEALHAHQPLQALTGATHAAAWCDLDGDIQVVREDVGRHNALDKLIGALLQAGYDPGSGFFAITSRASFEMVQRTVRAGVSGLAAVSAPTAMAVDLASRHGLLLAGFVRGPDLVVYAGADRLQPMTTSGPRGIGQDEGNADDQGPGGSGHQVKVEGSKGKTPRA